MDKAAVLAELDKFPCGLDGFWVTAGAALVLYGVRDETADIDLGCTAEAGDRLAADGYPYTVTEDGNRRFKIGGDVEVFENWLYGAVERVGGYPVMSLRGIREMKLRLGRDKDLRDVRLIDAFLARNKPGPAD